MRRLFAGCLGCILNVASLVFIALAGIVGYFMFEESIIGASVFGGGMLILIWILRSIGSAIGESLRDMID